MTEAEHAWRLRKCLGRPCKQLECLDVVHRGRHALTLASTLKLFGCSMLFKPTEEKETGHPLPAAAPILVALVALLHPPIFLTKYRVECRRKHTVGHVTVEDGVQRGVGGGE